MISPSASASVPRLQWSDVRFAYPGRDALGGVSLALASGEALGLLGPNGSGKSTLIALLCGLLRWQSGSLRQEGLPVHPSEGRYRSRLGVVFQHPCLDLHLTARQNLAIAATLHGYRGAAARERIEAQLESAGLSDRAGEPAQRLSGGLRRRLDLARALLPQPDLLLLDEPTAGLDEFAFRDTWDRLDRARAATGLSLLVATHRVDEAERCDRLAVMAGGAVCAVDTPEGLKGRSALDVIEVEGADPEAVADRARRTVELTGRIEGTAVIFEIERGHEWIPRLVEALGPGRLTSIRLRRPTLADAFLRITGQPLDGNANSEAA